jgi:hypothetical protein
MRCERCYKPANVGEHGLGLCPLEARRAAPTVRQDTIEGGLVIEHGLCNHDGTPRTYYSQSEIDRECKARGMLRWTDMHTEDKTKDARIKGDWYKSSEAQRARRDRMEARRERGR